MVGMSGAALIESEHLRMVLHLGIVDHARYRLEALKAMRRTQIE